MQVDSIPVLDMGIAMLIMMTAIAQTPQPTPTQRYIYLSKAASWLELNTDKVEKIMATYNDTGEISHHLTKLFERSMGTNRLKIVATREPWVPFKRIVALRFYPKYGVWVIIYE